MFFEQTEVTDTDFFLFEKVTGPECLILGKYTAVGGRFSASAISKGVPTNSFSAVEIGNTQSLEIKNRRPPGLGLALPETASEATISTPGGASGGATARGSVMISTCLCVRGGGVCCSFEKRTHSPPFLSEDMRARQEPQHKNCHV